MPGSIHISFQHTHGIKTFAPSFFRKSLALLPVFQSAEANREVFFCKVISITVREKMVQVGDAGFSGRVEKKKPGLTGVAGSCLPVYLYWRILH